MSALSDAIADLQLKDAALGQEVQTVITTLSGQSASIADLNAQIAVLTAGGTVTQDQIDALAKIGTDLGGFTSSMTTAVGG